MKLTIEQKEANKRARKEKREQEKTEARIKQEKNQKDTFLSVLASCYHAISD